MGFCFLMLDVRFSAMAQDTPTDRFMLLRPEEWVSVLTVGGPVST